MLVRTFEILGKYIILRCLNLFYYFSKISNKIFDNFFYIMLYSQSTTRVEDDNIIVKVHVFIFLKSGF